VSRDTGKLSREDVSKLTRALEEVAGIDSLEEREEERPLEEVEDPIPVPAEAA
jgi:hypothetical protein